MKKYDLTPNICTVLINSIDLMLPGYSFGARILKSRIKDPSQKYKVVLQIKDLEKSLKSKYLT